MVLINAGEAVAWVHCPRRAWYDRKPPPGFVAAEDRFATLIAEAGRDHENRIRERLGGGIEARSREHTLLLMAEGAPLIYQGIFKDHALGLAGRPDFLIRTENGDYQVADAKLASSLDGHPEIAIQLALYRRLTGTQPPPLVYLGSGEVAEVGLEADTLADEFLQEFRTALAAPVPPSSHFSESKCGACPYDATCRPAFKGERELTMVYGVVAACRKLIRFRG